MNDGAFELRPIHACSMLDECHHVSDRKRRQARVRRTKRTHTRTPAGAGEVASPRGCLAALALRVFATVWRRGCVLRTRSNPGVLIPMHSGVLHTKTPAGAGVGRSGVPKGIRTPVTTVKGSCPRPLDDGDAEIELSVPSRRGWPDGQVKQEQYSEIVVEPAGIEPATSCMPCRRSPS